jgi:hypothetical protein
VVVQRYFVELDQCGGGVVGAQLGDGGDEVFDVLGAEVDAEYVEVSVARAG